ncbi:MAG: YkgJ family cysteine cluster protein [Nanoarchaeota archaeon]|nr:YkgJ family cysteine cluster protein [Nanoarchaeota archaeon]MCK5629541.1 YkgJ family cysteine cluster protein [Nanoarchaeota archaeon]
MGSLKLTIDEYLQSARDKVSEYCRNECNALCCSNGAQVEILNPNDVRILLGLDKYTNLKDFAKKDARLKVDGFWFRYNYTITLNPCSNLDGGLCNIYNSPEKPNICSEYPIIKEKQMILLASKCPAVRDLKIKDDLELVNIMGYIINTF